DAIQLLPLPGTLLVGEEVGSDAPPYLVELRKPTLPKDVDLFGLLAADLAPPQEVQPSDTDEEEHEKKTETAAAPAHEVVKLSTPPQPQVRPSLSAVATWGQATASKVLAGVLDRSERPYRVRRKNGELYYEFEHCPWPPGHDGQHSHQCAVIVRAD